MQKTILNHTNVVIGEQAQEEKVLLAFGMSDFAIFASDEDEEGEDEEIDEDFDDEEDFDDDFEDDEDFEDEDEDDFDDEDESEDDEA